MTPHTRIGLVLVLVGVAIKVAAATGSLAGDIGFVGEIMALGTFLIGKELAPQSDSAAKRSLRPPPIPREHR